MTIICVDDERHTLNMIVKLCRDIVSSAEVSGFEHAEEALYWVSQGNLPQIALLDIDMPDMNGLILAKKIKELSPDTAIVFLTGYRDFAVDAYSLHASGYLLKPITRERLASEIEYVLSTNRIPVKTQIQIRTFGNFDIFINRQPVHFARSKSKELLALLVDRHGSRISRSEAFAVLYQNKPYDRANQKQLDVIFRCLRSTLEENGIGEILEQESGLIRIRPELVSCDLYDFLNGKREAIAFYRGEYMRAYSWAAPKEANIDKIRESFHH